MPIETKLLQDQKMTGDFDGAQFGDKRLDARSRKIASALACKPEESLPEVFNDDQELQNAYEFFGHDWLSFADLVEPHFEATAQRCAMVQNEICVIHDTTEFDFPFHNEVRENLSRFSLRRQGFFGHASLAIVSGEVACPLGYIAYQPFVHQGDLEDESSRTFWEKAGGLFDYEPRRWVDGIEQTSRRLKDVAKIVHIYDAEGDNYQVLMPMEENDHHFICRLVYDRAVYTSRERRHLKETLREQPLCFTRATWVNRQSQLRLAVPKQRRDAREAREATLEVRAMRLALARPGNATTSWPEQIELNVVHVREVEPPEGEEGLEWFLGTTESIDSQEEIESIIRKYEQRWLIEEANKAIKTGCAYTKRQLGSAGSLLNLLALTLPVSLDLLRFRYLSRAVPQWPATVLVTERQLQILQTVSTKVTWSDVPTTAEAAYAVAKLGGFLKRNERPGWQTLSRGYQTLLEYEIGWVAARRTSGPSN